MKHKILNNTLLGGITFGLFTYFVEIFEKHPNYLKISAFIWAAPLFFFLIIVYLPKSNGNVALQSFIIHALLGTILSVLIYIITLVMCDSSIYKVLLVTLTITILFTYIYFRILIK